ASVRLGAALVGWTATMLPEWSQAEIGTLVGIDRDEDYVDAEREEAACVLLVTSEPGMELDGAHLRDTVRRGRWFGRANQLSSDHVMWTFIDEIARVTEDRGRHPGPLSSARPAALAGSASKSVRELDARRIILQ